MFHDPVIPSVRKVNKPFMPRKLIPSLHSEARAMADMLLADSGLAITNNWRIYVVNQRCGRCYYNHKVLTIPLWVFTMHGFDVQAYYVAHELSHIFAILFRRHTGHGPDFMAFLKKLCPAEYIHHESGYKPRNASAAGIHAQANSINMQRTR